METVDRSQSEICAPQHADGLLDTSVGGERRRGRGAVTNTSGRYEPTAKVPFDDGWQSLEELPPFKTETTIEKPRKILSRNDSPDIGFDRSINPYRGCEHGCIYCFARPTHAYQGLSPGLPYQPIERKWRVTRKILEVLRDAGHPVAIVTKSGLVARDIDILSDMARRNLAKVALSVTTLDPKLARVMEPRAATPSLRLATIRKLSEAGIPAAVMVAPIVPAINDSEVERILEAAAAAGAQSAGYVMLRMPLEIRDLFRQWLKENFPDKHDHVISLVRSLHGGKDYDSRWGHRQTGAGPYAWSIGRRFELACKRIGLNKKRVPLATAYFQPPRLKKDQLDLFAA
jgi:DNA repair photolyase